RDATVTGVQTCALPISGVLVEQAGIGRDRLRAHLGHARTDSPDERDFLVLAEVEVVLRAQLLEQLAEVFAELGRALTDRVVAVRSEERRVGKGGGVGCA